MPPLLFLALSCAAQLVEASPQRFEHMSMRPLCLALSHVIARALRARRHFRASSAGAVVRDVVRGSSRAGCIIGAQRRRRAVALFARLGRLKQRLSGKAARDNMSHRPPSYQFGGGIYVNRLKHDGRGV